MPNAEMEVISQTDEIEMQVDFDSNALTQPPVEAHSQTQAPVPPEPNSVSNSEDKETNSRNNCCIK